MISSPLTTASKRLFTAHSLSFHSAFILTHSETTNLGFRPSSTKARQNVGDKVIRGLCVLPSMNDFVVGLGMWVCFVATVINTPPSLYQIINPLSSFSTRRSQLKYRFGPSPSEKPFTRRTSVDILESTSNLSPLLPHNTRHLTFHSPAHLKQI